MCDIVASNTALLDAMYAIGASKLSGTNRRAFLDSFNDGVTTVEAAKALGASFGLDMVDECLKHAKENSYEWIGLSTAKGDEE